MTGRWPANVILSPEMAASLDQQSGILQSGGAGNPGPCDPGSSYTLPNPTKRIVRNDKGGASKYFLTAGYEPWEYEWIIANGLTPCGE